jgi:hypothetical protein
MSKITSILGSRSNLTNGSVVASNYMMLYCSIGAIKIYIGYLWYCKSMFRTIFCYIYGANLHTSNETSSLRLCRFQATDNGCVDYQVQRSCL